mgnify:FL=1
MDKPSNVVFLDRELSRSKEAEQLLLERLKFNRQIGLSDDEYALGVMELQIKETVWAKKWGFI